MPTRLYMEITPMWSVIADIKGKIQKSMEGTRQGLIDFSVMVASELLENAIKYGVINHEISYVGLDFYMENSTITINVRNGIDATTDLTAFKTVMNKIKTSAVKSDLYIQRLQEILENPSESGSQLGLFRIVSEGNFDLDYKITDKVLEITATRKMD
ncbi:MAG TPA: hypothetical protein PKK94_27555 [Leptospiraceae bacterium]|nr:hypothetical protein [Leptospiraceae bacterium]